MKEQLMAVKETFVEEIKRADSSDKLEEIRVRVSGKKGALTLLLRDMGKLSKEERPAVGKLANEVREAIENTLADQKERIIEMEHERQFELEAIDITLPGKKPDIGSHHPLNIVIKDLSDIFIGLGFSVEEGPEIEWAEYNFDHLNIPKDHTSRDHQDTFYVDDDKVLRTQTSPIQIRTMMKSQTPPIRILAPGRVYRSDEIDATHSPVFHQAEGLVIDENITMSDLKGTLDLFAKEMFGSDTKTKFRPHQFYFTEPSAEMDVTCFICHGKGCRVCQNTGWIEILGCGMVHPNVLEVCGIDSAKYSGFAFGMGLDRIAMIKYGISDLRLMFENDIRFLKQFR
ncbi:phenylalanine--tRNA ligase subunit alpha [Alkalibacter saccharofermentans]|uniref:Phenylalanine--tRNA ligase alpha subunit n=1 Tax=Alkalibacter saccharofermentans DSM 14828 TaxID=1120975 RepID=A0A1M4UE39_9FIRM|nr:phenylalanine--tRNA ligase subunit alpha [Alkalibacter saccharofermentans]SHE54908.1 phenylalanyl-tRNA synthetase, alpha subunit [Alkalibacter saccharofermentans DSM 14828]